MLSFIDQLYKEADKKLGGWLPAGGTANPLSDAVRPVLETINPRDPSVSNYYRENRETAREQGKAARLEAYELETSLANQANDAASNAGATDAESLIRVYQDVYQSERGQEIQSQIEGLNLRALRHGVGQYGDLLPNASDRDAVLDNRANANLTADQIASVQARSRYEASPEERNRIRGWVVEEYEAEASREQYATPENQLGKTVQSAQGLSTADGPNGGDLACVYGVNKVIEQAGLEVPWKDPETGENSIYIPFVENWITSNGGSIVSIEEAQPGDIISDGGHMGILTDKVDGNGNKIVLSNSSSNASMTWEYPLQEGDSNKVYRVPQLQGN